ncbi:MAG TPA: hypothetical protein VHQ23_15330 [Ilumatobacteraceae bacterium]|nr:hypothetical protein [Ilumatobacteraceae bacterium]
MNLTLASSRAGPGTDSRRPVVADVTIVCSSAAALAHLVAAPSHYTWWPIAGVFFVVLGVAQLTYAGAIFRGAASEALLLAGIWGTVAVILLYVASRTVGIPWSPPVPFHGGRWVPGRSVVPDGAKYVGPLDIFTLVAELLVVLTSVSMLSTRSKARTLNCLMWVGLVLWGAVAVALL